MGDVRFVVVAVVLGLVALGSATSAAAASPWRELGVGDFFVSDGERYAALGDTEALL